MKGILIILFCFFTGNVFTQDTSKTIIKVDDICIPNNIAKEILKDLNDLDRLKEIEKLNNEEIQTLEEKIKKQELIILALEEKNKNSELIISKTEEKVTLIDEDNKELRKQNKKLRIKNTVIEIFTGVAIGTMIILQIF